MKNRQSARLAKLQAGRRAQQLPKAHPKLADEKFIKMSRSVVAAKDLEARDKRRATTIKCALATVCFCFCAAAVIWRFVV